MVNGTFIEARREVGDNDKPNNRPQTSKEPWVVLDLETTGLNPQKDLILECAALLVDSDLYIQYEYRRVVHHSIKLVDAVITPFVRDMHTKNGLLEAVVADCQLSKGDVVGTSGEYGLDQSLVNWCDKHGLQKIILVGNTIHFDRSFLANYCPRFMTRLHHRMIDVSSLNILHGAWRKPDEPHPPATASSGLEHRAWDDCISSRASLAKHRNRLWPSV